MNCPEMDRLIDFGMGQSEDSELGDHLQACEDCQADLRTIRALAGVGAPGRDLSEEMISQIIEDLPEPDAPEKSLWAKGLQFCLTWGLGFLTALVSVVVTGAIGTAGPRTSLLLARGFGTVCVLFSLHQKKDPTSSNGDLFEPEPA